jgi:hypothetical protein
MPKESYEAEGCHNQVARGVREEAGALRARYIKNQRARVLSEAKDNRCAISEAEIRKKAEATLRIERYILWLSWTWRRVCGRWSDSLYGSSQQNECKMEDNSLTCHHDTNGYAIFECMLSPWKYCLCWYEHIISRKDEGCVTARSVEASSFIFCEKSTNETKPTVYLVAKIPYVQRPWTRATNIARIKLYPSR